ncbi:MAG TPA: hypothetical protein VGX03_12735 [Candidatus Binatia bacterium]|nr:hypothetical protein [Candidatus Binatia bacterium]
MHRLRQASPSVFLFVVFLLHCSQTCLAAGHAHAAVTVPVSTDHNPEHAPCHSSPAAPNGIPDKCPDCADHVFLPSGAYGIATLAAAGSFFIPCCVLMQPVLPVLPRVHTDVLLLDSAALSPPRYLTFSVLRL